MNGNNHIEMYYMNNNNPGGGHVYHQQQHQGGYTNRIYHQNPTPNQGAYMGFFEVASPALPYLYPPLPPPQETGYWALNMNPYHQHQQQQQQGCPYTDEASSYYGASYPQDDPRPELHHRRTWDDDASSSSLLPHLVSSSHSPPDCPPEPSSDAASLEDAWQDEIDPDNMTYEELLDLGEAVGSQSRGLPQDLIKLLPTSRYKAGGFFSRRKSRERCVICLVTYKIGDQQITLPCKHVYHAKCGRKWLSINKTCPVCNSEVFGDEARN